MSESMVLSASMTVTQLLAWWQHHGRKDPAQRPWMFMADGRWPAETQALDPYGIWIAEVMLRSAP